MLCSEPKVFSTNMQTKVKYERWKCTKTQSKMNFSYHAIKSTVKQLQCDRVHKNPFFRSGNLDYFSFWQRHFGTCTISQSHRKAPFSCQVLSQKTISGFVFAVSNSLFPGSSIELCLCISLPSKQELLVNIEPFII